jgi:DNA repair protein RadC
MNNVSLALSVSDQIPVLPREASLPRTYDLPIQASPEPAREVLISLGNPAAAQSDTLGSEAPGLQGDEILRRLLSPVLAESDSGRAANELLARFGSLGAVLSADALQLGAVVDKVVVDHLQITYLAMQRVLRDQIQDRPIIGSWSALEEYAAIKLRHSLQERLLALFLDRRNGLIQEECMALGAFDQTSAYCREIARRALDLHAHAVCLAHNHPAGDPVPCRADVEITKRIMAVLSNLEVVFHDHAVVGRNTVVSMRSMHLI